MKIHCYLFYTDRRKSFRLEVAPCSVHVHNFTLYLKASEFGRFTEPPLYLLYFKGRETELERLRDVPKGIPKASPHVQAGALPAQRMFQHSVVPH